MQSINIGIDVKSKENSLEEKSFLKAVNEGTHKIIEKEQEHDKSEDKSQNDLSLNKS